jgi:thiol-disulfide isomerase/thioredoxin
MKHTIKKALLLLIILNSQWAIAIDLTRWVDAIDSKNNIKAVNEKKDNLGLIFIYSNACPYCRKFAPILKEFANETGLKVESITADGGFLPGFEDAVYSPELIANLNVKVYPTLFVIDNKSHSLALLAEGALSKNELYQNIRRNSAWGMRS